MLLPEKDLLLVPQDGTTGTATSIKPVVYITAIDAVEAADGGLEASNEATVDYIKLGREHRRGHESYSQGKQQTHVVQSKLQLPFVGMLWASRPARAARSRVQARE